MKVVESELSKNQSRSKSSLVSDSDHNSASEQETESRTAKLQVSQRDAETDSVDGRNEIYGRGFSEELKEEIKQLFGQAPPAKPKPKKRKREVAQRQKRQPIKKSMILSKKKTRSDQAYETEYTEERLMDWCRVYVRDNGQLTSRRSQERRSDIFRHISGQRNEQRAQPILRAVFVS
jgi:hypothetical protein